MVTQSSQRKRGLLILSLRCFFAPRRAVRRRSSEASGPSGNPAVLGQAAGLQTLRGRRLTPSASIRAAWSASSDCPAWPPCFGRLPIRRRGTPHVAVDDAVANISCSCGLALCAVWRAGATNSAGARSAEDWRGSPRMQTKRLPCWHAPQRPPAQSLQTGRQSEHCRVPRRGACRMRSAGPPRSASGTKHRKPAVKADPRFREDDGFCQQYRLCKQMNRRGSRSPT